MYGWTDSNISENHTQLKNIFCGFVFFLHPLGSLPKLDRFSCKDAWQEWLQALWIKPVMPKCCVGWWLDWIGWGMIRLMDFMKFPYLTDVRCLPYMMSDARIIDRPTRGKDSGPSSCISPYLMVRWCGISPKSPSGWWFKTFFIFHIWLLLYGIILPID